MGIAVTLKPYELAAAANTGIRRQVNAMAQGKKDAHGLKDPRDAWFHHINGACGEMAFAKASNRYWDHSLNTYMEGGDVGELQVRTRREPDYELLIRDNDPDERVYVLVTGVPPSFTVVGWMTAKEAKRDEWRKEHGGREPAYFVPQAKLYDIKLLDEYFRRGG